MPGPNEPRTTRRQSVHLVTALDEGEIMVVRSGFASFVSALLALAAATSAQARTLGMVVGIVDFFEFLEAGT